MIRNEQTLDELLSDPVILALMRADRVDPLQLRADFRHVASRLAQRPSLDRAEAVEAADWKRLLDDCLAARRSGGAASPAPGRQVEA
jgi:hypothetical protein